MKKKLYIGIASLIFLVISCTPTEKKIELVADKYLKTTSAYDIDEACKYCTPETAEGLQAIKKQFMPLLDSTYLQQNSKATTVIDSIIITSDTSANVLYTKTSPVTHYSDTLRMRCRNGRWMAHVQMRRASNHKPMKRNPIADTNLHKSLRIKQ